MQKTSKGALFVVSAPSGAGKTTLCASILESTPGLAPSVSFTTRKPREGEVNGVDYSFVSEEEFRGMVDREEFVEWATVHGNYYGTSRKRVEEILETGSDVLLDIDTQGARQIRQAYASGVFVFILPPSMKVLRERLENRRSNTQDDIERRLRRASDEIRDYGMYEYVIVNDTLNDSIGKLSSILTAERLRTRRIDAAWIEENYLG